ncbi:MAG TPA: transcription termination/antitermination protein NusG [Gemmatimonadota bacterium]|jgi:transcriptional antiterminator NusG
MRERSGSTGESVAEAEPRTDGAGPEAGADGAEDVPAATAETAEGGAAETGETGGAAADASGPAGEQAGVGAGAPEPQTSPPVEAAGIPEPEPREGMHWFALQVYLGHENKVKNLLQKRVVELRDPSIHIGDVMVPTQEVVEVKGGKKVKVTRNLYPGYLLVEMKPNEETLHFVNNVHGVIKFLGAGKLPQPLRPREIARILGKIEEIREAPEIVEIPFDPGDAVQVTDGPFSDFHGTVEEVYPEKGKVKVTVSLFGRPTSVELDYLQLRKL